MKKIRYSSSGTITDASGRTLSGQTIEAFVISISHIPLLSIGFIALGNNSYLAKRLSKITDTYTSVHPNADFQMPLVHMTKQQLKCRTY